MTAKERKYTFLQNTASTNAYLKNSRALTKAPAFEVVCANSQYAGRGRLGRDFFSPEGGAYFSASYPLDKNQKNIPFLTLLSGLAVSRAIEELTGVNTLIKWPNDIYLNGKKICGILCELVSTDSGPCAVVGAGINLDVKKCDIPADLTKKMTSFAAEGIKIPDKTEIIKSVVKILDGFVYTENALEDTSKYVAELNKKSFLFGKTVKYEEKTAVCGEISQNGGIKLIFPDGEKTVFSGEIIL